MKLRTLAGIMAVAGLAAPGIALATDGYFSHGFGVKSQGMGGVGIAFPQDSLAAATNPAGMVLVGDRFDVGVTWFRPQRETELGSNFGPFAGTYDGNDKTNFFIPEFGYNRMLNPNMSLGVSVYGNGGMNTGYTDLNSRTAGIGINPADPTAGILGHGKAGVDLEQLFISPTFAMKLNPNNAIGVAVNFAYQRFAAEGLDNFDNPFASSSPGNVTNRGHDSSTGWGARIGWTGQINSAVTLGATYQTKTRMGKFDQYKGLFAEQGSFDIPANYGVGIAVKATPQLTIAGDVVRIQYGDVKAIANSGSNAALLGSDNGPGFGWKNINVYKLGASYDFSQNLTLRAGWNHSDQPIPSDQTFFNILAPGVVQDHVTLGATWTLANKGEVSVGYMHAFKKTVNGSGTANGINIRMYEDSLGISYGMKL